MGIIYLTTNKINNKKYIGVDSKNNNNYYGSGKSIKLALKKYGTKNFIKEIIEENEDINYLFEKEKYWINFYDAINSKSFYNISEGGQGGSGTLNNQKSKDKHKIGSIKGLNKIAIFRKGKTYKEIYGEEKSIEEREKRRTSGLNKKYSDKRRKNISDGLKGNIPWNKGIKTNQIPWNIGKTMFFNTYYLTTPNNDIIKFEGKLDFKNYIKSINIDYKRGHKINIEKLIKNKTEKKYKLKITPFDNSNKNINKTKV